MMEGCERAWAQVDLGAIRSNVGRLRDCAPTAEVLAVVKADAYGHGLVPSAKAAVQGGATWLGVALLSEAVALRTAGIGTSLLAWLWAPGDPHLTDALRRGVEVAASSIWQLEALAAATHATGERADVQLKIDTGLARNGAWVDDWPSLMRRARELELDGSIRVTGVWSHFAFADEPGHPTVARQIRVFHEAVEAAEAAGLRPRWKHLANSAATLTLPEAHFNLVRPGIAVYGISPGVRVGTPAELGLTPAMTLFARVAGTKRVPPGTGVSYAHQYVTSSAANLALVPVGYADGVPRSASGKGPVLVSGAVRPVAGRVCMDQIVVDVGDDPVAAGDVAVLFGSAPGEPSVEDWARAADTIGYEIVTRLGPRIPRVHIGEEL